MPEIIEDRIQDLNAARRLPIVFCLDVSPSMGFRKEGCSTSIELLNKAVSGFIKLLQAEEKSKASAEIAFVTFSSYIEMNTDFKSVASIPVPRFAAVERGGTQMANAVIKSIEKIEARRRQLEDTDTTYYAPFLVLVTDSNPDENDNPDLERQAMDLVREHCKSEVGAEEIIVPFIIGVGDNVNAKTLNGYSAGFVDGFFHIKDAQKASQFNEVFTFIGNSVKRCVDLNNRSGGFMRKFKRDAKHLMEQLANG